MLEIIYRTRFKKDFKSVRKRGKNLSKLQEVLDMLVQKEILPFKYNDHTLIGSYLGRRECHIEPDWLLIYKIEEDYLILERTGSHADLFE